jgi:hypothetical protein
MSKTGCLEAKNQSANASAEFKVAQDNTSCYLFELMPSNSASELQMCTSSEDQLDFAQSILGYCNTLHQGSCQLAEPQNQASIQFLQNQQLLTVGTRLQHL